MDVHRRNMNRRLLILAIVILVCLGLYELSFRYCAGHFGEVNTDTTPISLYYNTFFIAENRFLKAIYLPREKFPLPLGKVRLRRGTGAYIEGGKFYRRTADGWENVTEAFLERNRTGL